MISGLYASSGRLANLALVALVAAGASGCASFEGWNAVQTKHIRLYTNTEQTYKETLRQLENAYATLNVSFFKGKEVGPIEVLFLEDLDFRGLFGEFRRGAALAEVPGDGKIGKKGLVIVRPHVELAQASGVSGDGTSSPLPTVVSNQGAAQANRAGLAAKEMMTHAFIDRTMPGAPLWFHEGMAAYVRSSQVMQGQGQTFACFGFLQPTEALMPLNQIFDMGFDAYAQPEARGWFQTTAYVLLDYTLHGDNDQHRGAVNPLLNGIATGTPGAELVPAAFGGVALGQLDENLKNHKQIMDQQLASPSPVRGQCPVGFAIPPEELPDESPPKIEPVPAAEIEALFRALEALPERDEYPPYYPKAKLEKVKVPAKG